MIGKIKPKSTSRHGPKPNSRAISRRCRDRPTFGGRERANQPSLVWIDDPISIRASLDDRTMSDTDAPAMSAPEPVAAPAPAPAAPVFDNAKVDELKLQATDKVQELYKKGKDKLDQVKNCQPLRSRASRPIPRVKMPSSSLTTSPPRPLLAVRPLRRQPQG